MYYCFNLFVCYKFNFLFIFNAYILKTNLQMHMHKY